jgi:hypothetical protein
LGQQDQIMFPSKQGDQTRVGAAPAPGWPRIVKQRRSIEPIFFPLPPGMAFFNGRAVFRALTPRLACSPRHTARAALHLPR